MCSGTRSEGAPSGRSGNPLGKREKSEEERFIRQQVRSSLFLFLFSFRVFKFE